MVSKQKLETVKRDVREAVATYSDKWLGLTSEEWALVAPWLFA